VTPPERDILTRIEDKIDNLFDVLWSHKVEAEEKFATKAEMRWALALIITTGLGLLVVGL